MGRACSGCSSHVECNSKRELSKLPCWPWPPSSQDCPFFVDKLKIRTLPCLVLFVGGVAVDRVVGFEPLGGVDDFPTAAVRRCSPGCPLCPLCVAAHCRRRPSAAPSRPTCCVPSALLSHPSPLTLRPQLEAKLLAAGVVDPPPPAREDSDDEGAALRARTMRAGLRQQQRTASDEDSDFD